MMVPLGLAVMVSVVPVAVIAMTTIAVAPIAIVMITIVMIHRTDLCRDGGTDRRECERAGCKQGFEFHRSLLTAFLAWR